PADLRPYLHTQIGYAVVGRGVTLLLFGAFFGLLAATIIALGRAGLREHLGWFGPALALGSAAAFVALGEKSRSAVPPTVAYAQLADAAAGVDCAELTGEMAVFRPDSGAAAAGAGQGGGFELDMRGQEGRVVRRVQTDLDHWHWENLDLPAGVRDRS